MTPTRMLALSIASTALIATGLPAGAAPKDNGKEPKEQHESKAKKHEHKNGKELLGERIKANGKHKLEQHGKHTAYANVQNGKIAGVTVTHSEKGEVPVKKYKTSRKMAGYGGMQPVSMQLAQASLGSTWIGYAFVDDYGNEVIYWYEYEMILDGDTGAVEYVPVY